MCVFFKLREGGLCMRVNQEKAVRGGVRDVCEQGLLWGCWRGGEDPPPPWPSQRVKSVTTVFSVARRNDEGAWVGWLPSSQSCRR